MKKPFSKLFFILILTGFSYSVQAQNYNSLKDSLAVPFKGDASIEVGSPFVGLEFHHSSPLAQRISFYYPAANSIDLSTDYWTRDQDYSMAYGIKMGNGEKEWLAFKPFEFNLTPFDVYFHKKDAQKQIDITYQFSKESPVFVITFKLKNLTGQTEKFQFYSDIQASLKTSHSYNSIEKASSEFQDSGSAIYVSFDEPPTQNVLLFTANAGLQPSAFSAISSIKSLPAPRNWWEGTDWGLDNQTASKSHPEIPAFRYVYEKELAPGESMKIVQIVGSAKQGEGKEIVERLLKNYSKEVKGYENHVLGYVKENTFKTGDSVLDQSVLWANSILDVNRHFIDGSIQPMPCPAQYNFYFTHDVLLTDLAAVNFDTKRVKQDLEFIISHADSNLVIPHAYYWKDSTYVTEFAPPDNWNHFWFVITAGTYLRHSGDKELLRELYPYLAKSVHEFQVYKKDGIIYSYRPDWWDIARNFGPRSYTTILAVKALREFMYISAMLEENGMPLQMLEQNADNMQKALNEKLWSDNQNYLINYFEDGSLDAHYYIGSLLASHYDLLDTDRKNKLTETAANKITDPKIGVATVYPMDFQNLIDYLKLNGNEAGDPHYYINGGIWPHGNAWYALSLIEIGKRKEALEFIKTVMTVEGVINSPNGQPAMYEYRISKKEDASVYGQIDKPQFTWAAGWYLYSLYNLYGIKETEWNIRFEPYVPEEAETVEFVLTAGGEKVVVNISGEGGGIAEILYDGKPAYSAVLPQTFPSQIKQIRIKTDQPKIPLLTQLNAVLKDAGFDENRNIITTKISSFTGHRITAVFVSPQRPLRVKWNNLILKDWSVVEISGGFKITVHAVQSTPIDELSMEFEK